MKHLKKLIPIAVVAAAMLVAANFMSGAPRSFADGGNCISWGTEYQTQLVQAPPRWAPRIDIYGHTHWRWISTSYYATVPVQVCLSYAPVVVTVAQPVASTVIYAPQAIYPYAYAYTPWGYLPTAAYYGKYIQPSGFFYTGVPQ